MKFVFILFLLFVAILISCDKNDMVIPPKADFKIDSTILFINDTIQLINLCEEIENNFDATSFQWYFEGGNPEFSNLSSPIVTYPNPGSFLVKLIARNKNGQDSIIKPDFIKINGMFAGKLDGINISYKVYNQSKEPFDSIDINEDGIYDIQFVLYTTCCHYRYAQIFAKGLNKTRISVIENSTNAKKHKEGDIITPKLIWSDDYLCLRGVSQVTQGPTTTYDSCGEFEAYSQDNYLCFNINDKAYGWINLSANASFFGSSLRIIDYAFSAIY